MPLSEMRPLPARGASMSSTYANKYKASKCIDGVDVCTTKVCATHTENSPWLSITVSANSRVGFVAVHNRRDRDGDLLAPFEVWVGNNEGASSTGRGAVRCGGRHNPPTSVNPFVADCNGAIGKYVTLKLPGRNRRLAICELVAYKAP